MYKLQEFIRTLDNFGITDVLLPFMLIFGIIFALLSKSKVLSDKKGLNIGLAAIMGAIPVIFHVTGKVPQRFDPILLISEGIPTIALALIAIIMLLALLGIFGGQMKEFNFGAIGIWSFGIIGIFVANSYFKNSTWATTASFVILIAMIAITFTTGFPSFYDLIFSILICFVTYSFGRRAGWILDLSHLNNSNFWPMIIIVLIFFMVTSMAVGDK